MKILSKSITSFTKHIVDVETDGGAYTVIFEPIGDDYGYSIIVFDHELDTDLTYGSTLYNALVSAAKEMVQRNTEDDRDEMELRCGIQCECDNADYPECHLANPWDNEPEIDSAGYSKADRFDDFNDIVEFHMAPRINEDYFADGDLDPAGGRGLSSHV